MAISRMRLYLWHKDIISLPDREIVGGFFMKYVDVDKGAVVGFLKFEGIVQEIFDVQLLRGIRFPEIAEPTADVVGSSFVLPDEALGEVAQAG